MKRTTEQALAFVRVSSAGQADNYSPESQARRAREYAKRTGLDLTDVVNVVESASKEGRAKWSAFVARVRTGPERHILFAKVDRSLRTFEDLALVARLPKETGKSLHFIEDGLILHPDSPPSDVLRLGIQGAVATYYVHDLAVKTKHGLEQKALSGKWPERAPYGYLNDKTTKMLVPDPRRAHWVVRIKALAATGLHSIDRIIELLVAEGYPFKSHRLHRSLVENVIRNPLYGGKYRWPKDGSSLIQGKHPPIVSWELHEAAVRGLERLNRPRYRKHEFVLAGLIRCGTCPEQRAVVFERKKGKYVYGHCTGTRGGACPGAEHVREEDLEEQVLEMLGSFKVTDSIATLIVDELARDAGADTAAREASAALIRQEISRLTTRVDAAYTDRLDGKIPEDQWLRQSRKWEDDRAALQERLKAVESSAPRDYIPSVREVLELAKVAVDAYKSASIAEKRELLDSTCSNFFLRGKKLDFIMKKPLDLLAQGLHSGDWLPESDAGQTDPLLLYEFSFGQLNGAKGEKRLLAAEAFAEAARVSVRKPRIRDAGGRLRFARDCARLLQAHPALTRAELAKRSGMTPARLNQIIGLLRDGKGR